MELQSLWGLITGVFVSPIVQWVKQKLPADLPITPVMLNFLLSVLLVKGIAALTMPEVTWNQILNLALQSFATATALHAGKNTVKRKG